MSSTWDAICLSHETPLSSTLWHGGRQAKSLPEALEALAGLKDHVGCRNVLEQVSGGTVAVVCLGSWRCRWLHRQSRVWPIEDLKRSACWSGRTLRRLKKVTG